jgi:hypothetical protein
MHGRVSAVSTLPVRSSGANPGHSYCTYLDQHYLTRGLSLYRSLTRHAQPFQLWVLCFDQPSYNALCRLRLPHLIAVSHDQFEKDDPALVATKTDRSRIEYYFTCTPSWPLFVLKHSPQTQLVTYVDADLFLFADPAPVFAELGDASVAIIEHRFAPHLMESAVCGVYNVGWLSFRRDRAGLECLNWWRQRCIEWCYDRREDGRYADQKYLDEFPGLFANVKVLRHKGANLAPWNVCNYQLRKDRQGVWVDDMPLIFYHFHALKQLRKCLFKTNLFVYRVPVSTVLRRDVYAPYIRTLMRQFRRVARLLPPADLLRSIRSHDGPALSVPRLSEFRALIKRGKEWYQEMATGDYYLDLGLLSGWLPHLAAG